MSRVRDLHEQWSQDPDYRAAYDALGPEFALARLLIEARAGSGAAQAELAERMKPTQPDMLRPPREGW